MDKAKKIRNAKNNDFLYVEGTCCYMVNERGGVHSGKYLIDINTMNDDSGIAVGSIINIILTLSTGVRQGMKISAKDVGVFDCNVTKVFDIVSKKAGSEWYGWHFISFTVKEIGTTFCMVYDFFTPKMESFGIPSYLNVSGQLLLNVDGEQHYEARASSDMLKVKVMGLSSCGEQIDSVNFDRYFKLHFNERTCEIIYMREAFSAKNEDKDHAFFDSLSVTGDVLNSYPDANAYIMPTTNSFYKDSNFIVDMIDKFVECYMKEQRWDAQVEI